MLVSESSGWHPDDHYSSGFSRIASVVGIMLNDSDLLLPSCDSSLGLSGQEELIPATSNAVSGKKHLEASEDSSVSLA